MYNQMLRAQLLGIPSGLETPAQNGCRSPMHRSASSLASLAGPYKVMQEGKVLCLVI